MKLLVLGGTVFLGRHVVRAALARGHEVVLFNRGKSSPDLFGNEVERLVGDRDGDLSALAGRRFDAVIDTCGYVPRIVGASADLLADAVEHYSFVSSISVYADLSRNGVDETAPVETLEDPTSEEIMAHYGGLKALCEQAVEARLPGRALHVRAGLLVGPDDPTDRFTYWVRRFDAGGDVLVPDVPDAPTQVIDIRDIAAWMVDACEARRTGTYNVAGPTTPLTFGEVVETCRAAGSKDARPVPVSEAFLAEQGVSPWTDVPLWISEEHGGMTAVSLDRAIASGLECRPLAETVADLRDWWRETGREPREKIGLTPEREAELLAAWADRS